MTKMAVSKGSVRAGDHNSTENMNFADKSTPVTYEVVREWVSSCEGANSKSGGT